MQHTENDSSSRCTMPAPPPFRNTSPKRSYCRSYSNPEFQRKNSSKARNDEKMQIESFDGSGRSHVVPIPSSSRRVAFGSLRPVRTKKIVPQVSLPKCRGLPPPNQNRLFQQNRSVLSMSEKIPRTISRTCANTSGLASIDSVSSVPYSINRSARLKTPCYPSVSPMASISRRAHENRTEPLSRTFSAGRNATAGCAQPKCHNSNSSQSPFTGNKPINTQSSFSNKRPSTRRAPFPVAKLSPDDSGSMKHLTAYVTTKRSEICTFQKARTRTAVQGKEAGGKQVVKYKGTSRALSVPLKMAGGGTSVEKRTLISMLSSSFVNNQAASSKKRSLSQKVTLKVNNQETIASRKCHLEFNHPYGKRNLKDAGESQHKPLSSNSATPSHLELSCCSMKSNREIVAKVEIASNSSPIICVPSHSHGQASAHSYTNEPKFTASRKSLRLRDRHCSLGLWMQTVSDIVATGNFTSSQAALSALGSVGLLAAEAAAGAAALEGEECSLKENEEVENISPAIKTCCDQNLIENDLFSNLSSVFCISPNNKPAERLPMSPGEHTPCLIPQTTTLSVMGNQNEPKPRSSISSCAKNEQTPKRSCRIQRPLTPLAPNRGATKAKWSLIRGIRMKSYRLVKQALTRDGADPNEYISLPSHSLPWNITLPWRDSLHNVNRAAGSPSVTVYLHPVHLASAVSSPAVVKELIKRGAFAGAVDQWGRHSIHMLLESSDLHKLFDSNTPTTSTGSHTPNNMINFTSIKHLLHQRTSDRPLKVEAQIAVLLCDVGLDLDRADLAGRTCSEMLAEWSRLSAKIAFCTEQAAVSGQNDNIHLDPIRDLSINRNSYECPIPVPPPRAVITKDGLLDLIPHQLCDVIILQQGRSRLEILSNIVGIDVGHSAFLSPTQAVRLRPQRILPGTPQPALATTIGVQLGSTPVLFGQSEEQQKSTIYSATVSRQSRLSNLTINSSLRIRTPVTRHSYSGSRKRNSSGFRGLSCFPVAEALSQLGPDVWNPFSKVTLLPPSTPGITKLSISRKLVMNSLLPYNLRAAHVSKVSTASSEAHNASSARDVARHETLYPSAEGISSNSCDDLTTFFRLAMQNRYHQALAGIWEFLGAESFPNSSNDTSEKWRDSLEL